MPEKSLPDNIELFLKGTVNSFIFLGFKFDSWYYQLICHKLGIRADAADMKTILSSPDFKVNDSIDVIMNSSFDMQFAPENPSQCIQTIIEICETDSPKLTREKCQWSFQHVCIPHALEGMIQSGQRSHC